MESSLMVNVSKITDCDFEGIIQSLITNVDTVWVNRLTLDINNPEIVKKIEELKEAGFIKYWDYEMTGKHLNSVSRIITAEEYRNTESYIAEMMEDINAHTANINNTITYDIENKNMLFNFLIANYCGAKSIIQRNNTQTIVKSGAQDLMQTYANCLFNETSIYSVSNLSVDDIIQLRKYSSSFRKKIKSHIDEHLINGSIPISVIKEDCHNISKEYCEEINSRIAGLISFKGTGISLAMDIMSFWIIPVTIYSMAPKLWDALLYKDQRGFVMYLTTLNKLTKK